ncbi:MAG TPA: thioredoxin family protein [Holophaga sp.]|jgi:thioredoxin 1|nr:thioredoxin family protein [Holophaga sp.]
MSFHRISLAVFAASTALLAQSAVPALDPSGLTQILKSGKWTVIEFGGPTCIPCKKMQPILAQLQAQYGDRAQFRNFYIAEHPKDAKPFKVMAMPTQVIFDPSGKEISRHIGFWEKAEFQAALSKAGLK